MNRSSIVLLVAALSFGAECAAAQTMKPDPTAPQTRPDAATTPDNVTSGTGHGDHAVRAPEPGTPDDGNNPPANPPAKDETVGVGGSVDTPPRDIRDPFDE